MTEHMIIGPVYVIKINGLPTPGLEIVKKEGAGAFQCAQVHQAIVLEHLDLMTVLRSLHITHHFAPGVVRRYDHVGPN